MGLTGCRVWLRLCRVLLGFGLRAGVDGVNFCHGLVSVGQAEGAGGGSGWALALLWGEGHGVVLLFCGKGSRSWGEWGRVVGNSRGVGGWVIGVLESVGGRAWTPISHLTSPWKGGRDELGEEE